MSIKAYTSIAESYNISNYISNWNIIISNNISNIITNNISNHIMSNISNWNIYY